MRSLPGFVGSFWPEPGEETLLEVAAGRRDRAASAWSRLRPHFDLDGVTRDQLDLMPLVYRRLFDLGIDDPDLARLKGLYRHSWSRNQQRFADLTGVISVLDGVGIPALVLKGAALAQLIYPEPALRPMGDIDVLVPYAQRAEAADAIAASGWAPYRPPIPGREWIRHGRPYLNADRHILDLHWHVILDLVLRDCPERSSDDFWAASVPLRIGAVSTRSLSPTDLLLHVVVHGSHKKAKAHLRWIADALVLIDQSEIDWERLLAQADRRRVVLAVRSTMTYLRRRFDACIPESVIDALAAMRVRPRDRVEFRARSDPDWLAPTIGGLSETISEHVQVSTPDSVPTAVLRFPAYLRKIWRLDHTWQVPVRAVRYSAGLARRRLARRPAETR